MRFPVEVDKASNRLFFALRHGVWHICDAALGVSDRGTVLYIALHGKPIYVESRADTALQAEILMRGTDRLCGRCMEEFELAKPEILSKASTRFDK